MSEKPSFFAELKRRNVYKVAIAYAVIAWLLIQAGSILFPTFEAPGWVMKVFVTIIAAGFPIALVIAWAFEMTPEGLKRTQDLSPNEVIPYWSRRKFATFIFGVAGTAFCLSAYHLLFPAPPRIVSSEPLSISQASPAEKSSSTQSVEQLLRGLDDDWAKTAAGKDLEQTVAFYSDDAVVFPPNSTSAATKEAIRNAWKEMFASPGFVITWQTTKARVGKSG